MLVSAAPVSIGLGENKPKIISAVTSIICLLFLLSTVYIYEQYQNLEQQEIESLESQQNQHLFFAVQELTNIINDVDTTVTKLANSRYTAEFGEASDFGERQHLQDMLYFIAQNEEFYSQLRLIAPDGNELIRVDNLLGETYAVPEGGLKNEYHQDYFQYARHLSKGQVGTWGIEQDANFGTSILPLQPSLLVIAPSYSGNTLLGYLVVSLDVGKILESIELPFYSNMTTALLDHQGRFVGEHAKTELLDLLLLNQEIDNLGMLNPALWEKMKFEPGGYLVDHNVLYSFKQLELGEAYSEMGEFILVSSKLESVEYTKKKDVLIVKSLMILILAAVIIYQLYRLFYRLEKTVFHQQLVDAAVNGVAGVAITDQHFRIVEVNREFSRVTGYAKSESFGVDLRTFELSFSGAKLPEIIEVLRSKKRWKGEINGKSKHGAAITLQANIQRLPRSIHGYGFVHHVITFTDISKRKQLELMLRNQSESDPLTGVWNRRKFDRELSNIINLSKRYKENRACIGLVDIDYFKSVNDRYGHDTGDQVLREVAQFLKLECRSTDIVARIGGEEFALIMPHSNLEQGYALMERLRAKFAAQSQLNLTISGGITEIKRNAELAYKQADIALYGAKQYGRNQIQPFDVDSTLTKAD